MSVASMKTRTRWKLFLLVTSLYLTAMALSGCQTLREMTALPEYESIPDSYGRPRLYHHP